MNHPPDFVVRPLEADESREFHVIEPHPTTLVFPSMNDDLHIKGRTFKVVEVLTRGWKLGAGIAYLGIECDPPPLMA